MVNRKKTFQELNQLTNGEFGLTMKVDYHDDGATMINYKYLKDYLSIIIRNYSIPKIHINRSKSEVIAKSNSESIRASILSITIDNNNR